jgi:hypothetical protein
LKKEPTLCPLLTKSKCQFLDVFLFAPGPVSFEQALPELVIAAAGFVAVLPALGQAT